MRSMQMSFTKGEITPLLHARVDLAAYQTALAELKNMIVLPQGGVTRRPGLEAITWTGESRLIPFEFNSSDTVLLDFSRRKIDIYGNVSGNLTLLATVEAPYVKAVLHEIKYVQSGNVIFLVHKNYFPYMLTRKSKTEWELTQFPYRGGPFISSTELGADYNLYLEGGGTTRSIYGDLFENKNLTGSLLKLEYAVRPKNETWISTGEGTSNTYEVKGTLNVVTTGDWTGTIIIERSSDGSATWVTMRQYNRTDKDTQGQWDFTISEAEAGILYRVYAKHDQELDWSEVLKPGVIYINPPEPTVISESNPATLNVTVSGFLKSAVYKINSIEQTNKRATITVQSDNGYYIADDFTGKVSLWAIGAWGNAQGYPSAVSMYQDRLVFAATDWQPQTIWMSRTGDYSDFSISDPLQDDDAVTITLAGSSADRIHSLAATSNLLAFTNSGEWLIRGAGDNGAITPSALIAHQQTNIGSKDIQPVIINGRVVFVQSQGEKVFVLGYDLNIDGYSGSELSILSSHIFEGKQIMAMAYQKIPDSILWFVLSDGSFVSCTYNPEHEVVAWARHDSAFKMSDITAVTGSGKTEIFFVASNNLTLLRLKSRFDNDFKDSENYESIIRTLRLNAAESFVNKKFISRVSISALNSDEAWIAPGDFIDSEKNWERRRKITWDNVNYLTESEIQLDNGFDKYACIQIRSIDDKPLTIAAIIPQFTTGAN